MSEAVFRVVEEFPDFLIIEKLRPFLSQPSESGQKEGIADFISRARQEKLIPIHRLDREVLGLMVIGRTSFGAKSIGAQFRNRSVTKIYKAKVHGLIRDDEGVLVHYLKKNPRKNYVTVFPREAPGAQRAELHYRVKERLEGETWLEVDLKTGRTHQIRAQLAKIGHPIVGDNRYGKHSYKGEELIFLKAIRLGFRDPRGEKDLSWDLS